VLPRIEFILVATEKELQGTQSVKDLRSTEYAIRSDFWRIYVEQMDSLYLLSGERVPADWHWERPY